MTRRKPQPTEEAYVPLNSKRDIISQVVKKRPKGKFLTENQKIYSETLLNNQITICSGPAGVGKSYVAMKTAVDLLLDDGNGYDKIIIVRPAVEAEEKL
jgi:phosphate starvation-inducible PhoH-like protein